MGVPAICALAMLIFIRTFESFEVPALVGLAGNINVLTTTIYQSARRTGAPNYGESGAYSICLVLIVTVLLIWQSNLARNAHRYQTITGKGFRPRIVDLGALAISERGVAARAVSVRDGDSGCNARLHVVPAVL